MSSVPLAACSLRPPLVPCHRDHNPPPGTTSCRPYFPTEHTPEEDTSFRLVSASRGRNRGDVATAVVACIRGLRPAAVLSRLCSRQHFRVPASCESRGRGRVRSDKKMRVRGRTFFALHPHPGAVIPETWPRSLVSAAVVLRPYSRGCARGSTPVL